MKLCLSNTFPHSFYIITSRFGKLCEKFFAIANKKLEDSVCCRCFVF